MSTSPQVRGIAELNTAFVFAVITASWRGQDIGRRVVELGFLSPAGELTPLTNHAAHNSPTHDPAGLQALAAWSGIPTTEIKTDLARRAAQWR